MHAKKGDWLVVESSVVDRHSRRGIVLRVEGPEGTPPFLVRWEDNGHEGLVFPGPDAHIAAAASYPVAAIIPDSRNRSPSNKGSE